MSKQETGARAAALANQAGFSVLPLIHAAAIELQRSEVIA